jgi:septal ring-binding cell division protein DamX
LQIKSLPTDTPVQEAQLQSELQALSQQLPSDNIYLYRKKQNDVLYTVILYGTFTQRSEALNNLNNLPESIQSNHPYLRTIGGIKKDIQQPQ